MKSPLALWYSRQLYKHPVRLFLIGLLMVASILPGLSFLQADYSFRLLHSSDNPKLASYDLFEKNFGNDDSVSVAIYAKDGIFSKQNLEVIKKLQDELQLLPGVMRVESILEGNVITSGDDFIEVKGLLPNGKGVNTLTNSELTDLKKNALGSSQIVSYLVSEDAQLGFIHLFMNPSRLLSQTEIYSFSSEVEKVIEKHRSSLLGGEIFLTGSAYLTKTLIDVSRNDQKRLGPIILIFFSLISFLVFRSLKGVCLILIIMGVNVLCALGIQGYLHFPVNSFTSALGIIVTVITTGAIMHLLASFYRSYNKSKDLYGSVIQSFSKNLAPTFMTSFTTALGFYSLADKSLIAVFQLGVVLGTACLVSWLVIYTLLGPLVLTFHKQEVEVTLDENGLPSHQREVDLKSNHFSRKVTDFTYNHRKKIILFWLIALVASLLVIPSLKIGMNPFAQFSEKIPIMQTKELIKEKMGFSVFIETMIDTEEIDGGKKTDLLKRFETFERELLEDPTIVKSVSFLSIIKELNQIFTGEKKEYKIPDSDAAISQYLLLFSFGDNGKLKNFLSEDGRYLRTTLFSSLERSDLLLDQMKHIEEVARKHKLNLVVTGKLPLFMELGLVIFKVIGSSSFIGLLLIGFVLFAIVRSFKLGWLALLPNVLPVLLCGGIMKLLGYSVDISTTLIFSVCLGISVDDTIHFFYHWKKYQKEGKSPFEALETMVLNLYPIIIATTFVLTIGFGAFAFADFLPNVKFGILTAIILNFAMLADLTLLPALLLLGEKKR